MVHLLPAILLLAGPSAPSAPTIYWQGESAGFFVEWSSADLSVRQKDHDGALVLSFAAMRRAEWAKAARSDCRGPNVYAVFGYRLLSVVGPYLSFEESDEWECGGAHPSASTRYRAIDLRKSHDGVLVEVSLKELFAEADILKALLADKVVRESMEPDENGRRVAKPRSLAAFFKAMATRMAFTNADDDCAYDYRPEILRNFAFHHREKDRVAVRISLPYAAEMCRGTALYLGVWLPVPAAMEGELAAAATKSAGVLMADASKAKDAQTSLEFPEQRRKRK